MQQREWRFQLEIVIHLTQIRFLKHHFKIEFNNETGALRVSLSLLHSEIPRCEMCLQRVREEGILWVRDIERKRNFRYREYS